MPANLQEVAAARTRIALLLTAAMMVLYFGFILLVAFNKPLLARQIVPGVSVGILGGVVVILAAWVLVWIYVRWANAHYDHHVTRLKGGRGTGAPAS